MALCCVVGDNKQLNIPHPTFPCVHEKCKRSNLQKTLILSILECVGKQRAR